MRLHDASIYAVLTPMIVSPSLCTFPRRTCMARTARPREPPLRCCSLHTYYFTASTRITMVVSKLHNYCHFHFPTVRVTSHLNLPSLADVGTCERAKASCWVYDVCICVCASWKYRGNFGALDNRKAGSRLTCARGEVVSPWSFRFCVLAGELAARGARGANRRCGRFYTF